MTRAPVFAQWLAYQPIVRTADGWVTGVEALLRWQHPQRGLVPTAAAIRVAEQSGLINELGLWVLKHACFDRDRWLMERPDAALDLTVNISTPQLLRPDFCTAVEKVLAETEMDPAALIFDMTETVLMDDADRIVGVLHELGDLGIRFAMDDFGTGYSSLSFLRNVPIYMVKIDPSFITDIERDASRRAVVSAVVGLGHLLGLKVVAEGVETQVQRDEIDSIGCDAAQGHFYAVPMSPTGSAPDWRTTPPDRSSYLSLRTAPAASGREPRDHLAGGDGEAHRTHHRQVEGMAG